MPQVVDDAACRKSDRYKLHVIPAARNFGQKMAIDS
jgi:hypothetical protein